MHTIQMKTGGIDNNLKTQKQMKPSEIFQMIDYAYAQLNPVKSFDGQELTRVEVTPEHVSRAKEALRDLLTQMYREGWHLETKGEG